MINKIIFFNYQSLTEKIIEDFFFLNFINNGFDIEYWDLTNIVFKNKITSIKNNQSVKIIKFDKIKDFEVQIKQLNINQTLFVSLVTYEYRVLSIFKILTKHSCKTSIFSRGAQPLISNRSNYYLFILSRLKSFVNLNKITALILNKYAVYLKKIRKVKSYDIVFCAGLEGLRVIGQGYEIDKANSEIHYINSIDYDKFQNDIEIKNDIPYKYCVFLDEYLPYHPDFELLNIKTIPPDRYYNSLNSFFEIIEKKYKIKVIIAAHPKALLYKNFNPFEGRSIIFNNTSKLVKFSEFVIAQNTTSISFAILNLKQVLIVSTKDIINNMPNYNSLIKNNSLVLGTNVIYIDLDDKISFDLPKIDESKYKNFKYNFLTTKESQFDNSFEIIRNAIINI
jgi:hypothetical protein